MPRAQEFAFLAFLAVQLSAKEGEDFLLKKATLKMLRDTIKTSPFMVPTIRKEAPTGNAPMGATPLKAVTNRFPQVGGNRILEAPGEIFDPTPGDKGMETPPIDSSKASLSPPDFQKRLENKQMLRHHIKHYHQ